MKRGKRFRVYIRSISSKLYYLKTSISEFLVCILKIVLAFLFPTLNKEHRKISSKARKEIIVDRIIPVLNDMGFKRPPFRHTYGWNPPAYEYVLVKQHNDELIFVSLYSRPKYNEIFLSIYICKIFPVLPSLDHINVRHSVDLYQNDSMDFRDMYRFSNPFKLKLRLKNRRYVEWKKNRLAKKIIKLLSSDKPINYWNKHRCTETLDWNGNVIKASSRKNMLFKRWVNQPIHADSNNI